MIDVRDEWPLRPLLRPLLRTVSVLLLLMACQAGWANGDHPLRLPPPDPGPALAKIEAEARAAPPVAVPVVAESSTPLLPGIRDNPGHAIFSPFSASAASIAPSASSPQASGSAADPLILAPAIRRSLSSCPRPPLDPRLRLPEVDRAGPVPRAAGIPPGHWHCAVPAQPIARSRPRERDRCEADRTSCPDWPSRKRGARS